MMMMTEAPYDTDVPTTSISESSTETDDAPLFPSLDDEQNLLTPLWRDADLLG